MLAKAALAVKSKVAIAVLGVLVAGTGGTAALAATGHLPSLPTQANATPSSHSQQDNANHGHTVSIEGTLKAYNASGKTISVQPNNETSSTTIAVNSDTRVNGVNATKLSDLSANIGHKVQVQATKPDKGSLIAWKITVEGDGATGDHGQPGDTQHDIVGTISSVTATGFVVKTATGDQVTVVVNTKTAFSGAASTLTSVKTGMRVEIHGTTQSNGSFLADTVRVVTAGQDTGQSGDHSGSGSSH